MANDFTGRIWKITSTGNSGFSANVKIKGGNWSGMSAAGQTFQIVDEAGRTYTFTSSGANIAIPIYELGWLSGPVAFTGTFSGEIDLFLATK
jgi:carbon monoxide dehydrogenase subunit G